MSYIEVNEDFNSKYNTYVIAYCMDVNSWFITNERHWFFQFDNEFNSYEDAEKYFKDNNSMILNKQNEILKSCGQKSTKIVHLQKPYSQEEI